jgi:K+-sensing histidine kinase KdpD
MTTSPHNISESFLDSAADLLDSLFYSVSHDLRSPLLTVSLSAQVLEHTLGDDIAQSTTEALNSLRAASTDLERMLATLNALSRATRRPIETTSLTLDAIAADAPDDIAVLLDRATATDIARLIAASEQSATIEQSSGQVTLGWAIENAPEASSPLTALTASLQNYAGTLIEGLACVEIALNREGGSLELTQGHVRVSLPLDGPPRAV